MPDVLAVTFVQVQADNITQLRALNVALFPVKYQVSSPAGQSKPPFMPSVQFLNHQTYKHTCM